MQSTLYHFQAECVEELCYWLKDNMLKLHESITDLHITSPFHMARFAVLHQKIQIGEAEIFPSPTVKNLGVHFDAIYIYIFF